MYFETIERYCSPMQRCSFVYNVISCRLLLSSGYCIRFFLKFIQFCQFAQPDCHEITNSALSRFPANQNIRLPRQKILRTRKGAPPISDHPVFAADLPQCTLSGTRSALALATARTRFYRRPCRPTSGQLLMKQCKVACAIGQYKSTRSPKVAGHDMNGIFCSRTDLVTGRN